MNPRDSPVSLFPARGGCTELRRPRPARSPGGPLPQSPGAVGRHPRARQGHQPRLVRVERAADVQGGSGALGDVFTFEVEGVHRSTQRVTAFEPGRLLEWTVEEAWLSFVARPDEWRGSRIRFELAPLADGRTELTFTHLGLTPAVECFEACSGGWMFYVAGSLRRLATEGEGEPHRAETGLREFEHDLLDAHGAG